MPTEQWGGARNQNEAVREGDLPAYLKGRSAREKLVGKIDALQLHNQLPISEDMADELRVIANDRAWTVGLVEAAREVLDAKISLAGKK